MRCLAGRHGRRCDPGVLDDPRRRSSAPRSGPRPARRPGRSSRPRARRPGPSGPHLRLTTPRDVTLTVGGQAQPSPPPRHDRDLPRTRASQSVTGPDQPAPTAVANGMEHRRQPRRTARHDLHRGDRLRHDRDRRRHAHRTRRSSPRRGQRRAPSPSTGRRRRAVEQSESSTVRDPWARRPGRRQGRPVGPGCACD